MARSNERAARLSSELRALVDEHRWVANAVVAAFLRAKPGLDADELRSRAHEALALAALTFDRTRGPQFRSHAWARIELSLRDGARKQRRQRAATLAMISADSEFAAFAALGSGAPSPFASPKDVEGELRDELLGALAARLMGATSAASADPETLALAEESRRRTSATLAAAREALPERDQALLRLRYDEQLELTEISRLRFPEVPYSTVTRYHRDALVRLGNELKRRGLTRP